MQRRKLHAIERAARFEIHVGRKMFLNNEAGSPAVEGVARVLNKDAVPAFEIAASLAARAYRPNQSEQNL